MSVGSEVYQVEHRLMEDLGGIVEGREAADRALIACAYRGDREDVMLVVSELVTNALIHGDGAPMLRLTVTSSRIRIEVGDAGAELPRLRDPDGRSGWGLHVVKQLSTSWGVIPRDEGKVVWCELSASGIATTFNLESAAL